MDVKEFNDVMRYQAELGNEKNHYLKNKIFFTTTKAQGVKYVWNCRRSSAT